jgi:acetyl-CoA carboxylase biotin carboxyl carrier protein
LDIRDLKKVVDLINEANLTEFELEEENFKIRIKRGTPNEGLSVTNMAPLQLPMQAPAPVIIPQPGMEAAPGNQGAPAVDPNVEIIKSPMVGTFYRSPSPESPVFVDIGSSVNNETIVCIVEAMKVMNEIKADLSGKIIEVLVESGEPVEYGQPLFKVKKG